MATKSFGVGQVARPVSTTRITNAPGGKQHVNLFAKDEDIPSQVQKAHRAPPGGNVSNDNVLVHPESENSGAANNIVRPKSKSIFEKGSPVKIAPRAFAPGGKSSINFTFDETLTDVPVKSSTRIHNAPGGKSAMADMLDHSKAQSLPVNKKPNPQQKSNVFSDDAAVFKSSTKRLLVPGGQSSFSLTDDGKQDQESHSIYTARANQSKNLFNLSPPDKSRRPVNPERNKSSNVTNLTPTAHRTLPRSFKALEETSQSNAPKPVCTEKYATHNKMMTSNIFAEPVAETAPKRSSVKLHHPAGGVSSNIFG